MIFYASALSSYSAKVRIVLAVKELAFDEVAPPGGYRSDEYRALVPMGTLPAIRIGDWVLSESEAINEFLEDAYPAPAMLPADARTRAQVRFLCRFHDLYLEPTVRGLFGHVKPDRRDDEQVARVRADIVRRIDQLAAWVQPQPWLLTPAISLADCGPLVNLELACELLRACNRPIDLPPVLQRWHAAASDDEYVRKALEPWRLATRQWLGDLTS